ncbi:MAG: hypothetical protein ABIG89_03155 [Candidatus Woesearchaeota archaeon]
MKKRSVLLNIAFTALALSILLFAMLIYTNSSRIEDNNSNHIIDSRINQKYISAEKSINKIFNRWSRLDIELADGKLMFNDEFLDSNNIAKFWDDLSYLRSYLNSKTGLDIDILKNTPYHIILLQTKFGSKSLYHKNDASYTMLEFPFTYLTKATFTVDVSQCISMHYSDFTTEKSNGLRVEFRRKAGDSLIFSKKIDITKNNLVKFKCEDDLSSNTVITIGLNSDKITYSALDTSLKQFSVRSEFNYQNDKISFIGMHHDFGMTLQDNGKIYDLPLARVG